MSLRLNQAPREYDPREQNQFRAKLEDLLAEVYRSNARLVGEVDTVTPVGRFEFLLSSSNTVTLRVVPLENTLSFGYTVETAAFDTDRSNQTLANFVDGDTPYDVALGTLAPAGALWVTIWFYEAAGGTGVYSSPTAQRYAPVILEGGVDLTSFFSGLRPVRIVAALPESGDLAGDIVLLTTDSKLYRWTGSAWTVAVPTSDLTGQIQTAQIANLAVTAAQIGAAAVETAKLANEAVTEAILAAGAVTETKIEDDAITTPKIVAGAIVAEKIATNAVTADKIIANAVIAGKIAAGAVEADKIAAGAVTTAKLDALAVTADKIAALTITAGQIATDAITSDKIIANAITAGKIAAGQISASHIAALTITAAQIASDAITAAKIAAGQITATHLASQTLSSVADPSNKYIDWGATGVEPFIKHPSFELLADGTARFGGDIELTEGENTLDFFVGADMVSQFEAYTNILGDGIRWLIFDPAHPGDPVYADALILRKAPGDTGVLQWDGEISGSLLTGTPLDTDVNDSTARPVRRFLGKPLYTDPDDLDAVSNGSVYARMIGTRLSSGVLKRAGALDDGLYLLQSNTTDGKTITTTTTDIGGRAVNRFYGKALSSDADTLDSVGNGSTYARLLATKTTSGVLRRNGALDDGVYALQSNTTDGRTVTTSTTDIGGRAVNKFYAKALSSDGDSLDSVVDGSSYGRVHNNAIGTAGVIDFSKSGFASKNLDNVSDGSSYARILANRLASGAIKRAGAFDDGEYAIRSTTTDGRTIMSTVSDSGGRTVAKFLAKPLTSDADDLDAVTNGTTFKKVAGVNGSNLVTSGSVSSRARCRVHNSTSVSVTSGSWQQQIWDTEAYDVGGIHATGTGQITVPSDNTGPWQLAAQVAWDSNTTGRRGLAIYKNGTSVARVLQNAADGLVQQVVFADSSPANGDIYTLFCYQDSGTTRTLSVTVNNGFFAAGHHW